MKTVFDVGANIGDWTKLALQAIPGVTIHAFELSEATRAAFRRNITALNVLLVDAPLGSDDGHVQFKDFGDSSGLNTIVTQTTHHDWRAPKLRECIAMRGDTYCKEHGVNKIDLMKVDVEGYESAVLEGFGKMLKPDTIRCIQFEYGYGNGDLHWLMKDFNDYLHARGYIVGKLWHDGVSFAPFDYAWNNFDSGPNYVAVGRDDVELRDLVDRKQTKPQH
ncbi:MAG: FkbM family methyltransferase [Planctomycetaceae bacterium]|nr:FkbM family methyltransferase [Planctomycetaceae bacterium]